MVIQTRIDESPLAFCDRCGKPLSNEASIDAHMGPVCRAKVAGKFVGSRGLDYGKPEASPPWRLFEYHSKYAPQGKAVAAYLTFLNVQPAVFILAQPRNYTGYSVTNGFPEAATHLAHVILGLRDPLFPAFWVEHYAEPEVQFDLVTMAYDVTDTSWFYSNVFWSIADREFVESLIGMEIPRL